MPVKAGVVPPKVTLRPWTPTRRSVEAQDAEQVDVAVDGAAGGAQLVAGLGGLAGRQRREAVGELGGAEA